MVSIFELLGGRLNTSQLFEEAVNWGYVTIKN